MLVEETQVEESDIWLDDGHLDAVADEFKAEGFRQAVDGVFRSGVHGEARFGIIAFTRHTSHVNNPPWMFTSGGVEMLIRFFNSD